MKNNEIFFYGIKNISVYIITIIVIYFNSYSIMEAEITQQHLWHRKSSSRWHF